jgi:general nucleoside transport system ATP-binding protein
MIHQHFMLVPTMTVAQNVALGQSIQQKIPFDLNVVSERICELSAEYGLKVNPNDLVGHLSVGEQQRVEIIKALYRGASIIILDEPTAVLTPQEVDDLFIILKKDGKGRPRPRLHLPQAARGYRPVRPHYRAAGRQDDGHEARRGREAP